MPSCRLVTAAIRLAESPPLSSASRAGARTRAQLAAFEEIVGPFDRRGRVYAPSSPAYIECGRVLSELTATGKIGSPIRASFLNDLLIAISSREHGITVVTHNTRDFSLIGQHVRGLSIVEPWPKAGRPR